MIAGVLWRWRITPRWVQWECHVCFINAFTGIKWLCTPVSFPVSVRSVTSHELITFSSSNNQRWLTVLPALELALHCPAAIYFVKVTWDVTTPVGWLLDLLRPNGNWCNSGRNHKNCKNKIKLRKIIINCGRTKWPLIYIQLLRNCASWEANCTLLCYQHASQLKLLS